MFVVHAYLMLVGFCNFEVGHFHEEYLVSVLFEGFGQRVLGTLLGERKIMLCKVGDILQYIRELIIYHLDKRFSSFGRE